MLIILRLFLILIYKSFILLSINETFRINLFRSINIIINDYNPSQYEYINISLYFQISKTIYI